MKLASKLLLIKVDPSVEQDENGVYITEEWRKNPPTGTIEAVASDVSYKVGERVWFDRYQAIGHYADADLRLCREDMIFGVIK